MSRPAQQPEDDRPDEFVGDFRGLESKIRQAGGYVVPTDTFRARVLEAARDRAQVTSVNRRVFGLALACVFGLILMFQVTDYLRAKCYEEMEWPATIREHVAELNDTPGVGPNWATYEAVKELRGTSNLRWSQSKVGTSPR